MPSVEVRLPPSGASPWQRVRSESLDDRDCLSISDYNTQVLPALDSSALISGDIVACSVPDRIDNETRERYG
jgi:hypothetical protein